MTIEGSARPAGEGEESHSDGHHHPQVEKGLSANSVGLLGGTVLGISCVAPAYTLTATIGLIAAVAGVKIPVIFIAGFIPMFFAAYAYREFNRVDPDNDADRRRRTLVGPGVGPGGVADSAAHSAADGILRGVGHSWPSDPRLSGGVAEMASKAVDRPRHQYDKNS